MTAGRPNNRNAIAAHVAGLREAKAAFQKLPEAAKDRLLVATETTVREIVRGAKARVLASPSVQTKSLYNAIGWSLNRKSGLGKAGVSAGSTTVRTGYTSDRKVRSVRIKGFIIPGKDGGAAGARLVRPSRYAHLVEFGARGGRMKAEPFMIPASEAERQPYIDRCRGVGRLLEKDVQKVGMSGSSGLL